MKVHLRFDKGNEAHQELTVFVNGQNNGKLVLSPAQATWFYFIVQKGCEALSPAGLSKIEFVGSGKCYYPTEESPLYSLIDTDK